MPPYRRNHRCRPFCALDHFGCRTAVHKEGTCGFHLDEQREESIQFGLVATRLVLITAKKAPPLCRKLMRPHLRTSGTLSEYRVGRRRGRRRDICAPLNFGHRQCPTPGTLTLRSTSSSSSYTAVAAERNPFQVDSERAPTSDSWLPPTIEFQRTYATWHRQYRR